MSKFLRDCQFDLLDCAKMAFDLLESTYQFDIILFSWVNKETNGKIKEILPGSANTETRVILANAIYFKAEWQESFIEGATGFKKFYPNGRDNDYSILVELMAHGGSLQFLSSREIVNF
jgi:serine protease inhibitor